MYETLRKLIVDAELPNATEMFSTLDLTFSVELSPDEGGKRVDLIPGGHECAVTPANVRSYARKYALQRMETCAKKALKVWGDLRNKVNFIYTAYHFYHEIVLKRYVFLGNARWFAGCNSCKFIGWLDGGRLPFVTQRYW